ncbi:MAG: hypothetical protein K0U37_01635 [Gammaproteobacteria bacterium]|nr:hypothetical protein [Gammaproteobacteria bacterium]
MPVLKKGSDKIYQDLYRDIGDKLRRQNDYFFNISSFRGVDETGQDIWVRDASHAYELGDLKRAKHDEVKVESNNMLMRCLSRLRGIDYAISAVDNPSLDVKPKGESKSKRELIRDQAQAEFSKILQAAKSAKTGDEILALEKAFNTHLVRQLHEADLTEGCLDAGSAEKLLSHYRNLSSVLDPAMPLVTLTYDKASGMAQREIQYPVTKKTKLQKKEVNKLREIVAHPSKQEKNSHTVNNLATQRADACFADMLASDDRMLSAQARKTHLAGVKNAFIVKTDTLFGFSGFLDVDRQYFKANPMQTWPGVSSLWLARTGVPVFVGQGENNKTIYAHTSENLKQIGRAAKKLMGNKAGKAIHLTVLNTDSSAEKQDKMLVGLRHEISNNANNQHEMSNVPVNDYGTARFAVSLSLAIREAFKARKGQARFWWTAGQKANRLRIAVDSVLAAAESGYLSLVNCASGQDRTGTVIEKAIQENTLEQWMKWFREERRREPTEAEIADQIEYIQAMRARGFNAAEIASHMAPGSPGMKSNSKANNFFDSKRTFGSKAEREFYLQSAKTNKENKVDSVSFLSTPASVALDEFERRKLEFEEALGSLSEGGFSQGLKDAGFALYTAFAEYKPLEDEEEEEARLSTFKRANKMRRALGEAVSSGPHQKSARNLANMTEALRYATEAIKDLKSGDVIKAETAIDRMMAMRKVLPGHERLWLKIAALAMAAVVALLVIAICSYPPAAVFLLMVAGVVGAFPGIFSTIAVTSAAGVTSAGAWYSLKGIVKSWNAGKEKGKAKVVGDFKTVIDKEKNKLLKDGTLERPKANVAGKEDDLDSSEDEDDLSSDNQPSSSGKKRT